MFYGSISLFSKTKEIYIQQPSNNSFTNYPQRPYQSLMRSAPLAFINTLHHSPSSNKVIGRICFPCPSYIVQIFPYSLYSDFQGHNYLPILQRIVHRNPPFSLYFSQIGYYSRVITATHSLRQGWVRLDIQNPNLPCIMNQEEACNSVKVVSAESTSTIDSFVLPESLRLRVKEVEDSTGDISQTFEKLIKLVDGNTTIPNLKKTVENIKNMYKDSLELLNKALISTGDLAKIVLGNMSLILLLHGLKNTRILSNPQVLQEYSELNIKAQNKYLVILSKLQDLQAELDISEKDKAKLVANMENHINEFQDLREDLKEIIRETNELTPSNLAFRSNTFPGTFVSPDTIKEETKLISINELEKTVIKSNENSESNSNTTIGTLLEVSEYPCPLLESLRKCEESLSQILVILNEMKIECDKKDAENKKKKTTCINSFNIIKENIKNQEKLKNKFLDNNKSKIINIKNDLSKNNFVDDENQIIYDTIDEILNLIRKEMLKSKVSADLEVLINNRSESIKNINNSITKNEEALDFAIEFTRLDKIIQKLNEETEEKQSSVAGQFHQVLNSSQINPSSSYALYNKGKKLIVLEAQNSLLSNPFKSALVNLVSAISKQDIKNSDYIGFLVPSNKPLSSFERGTIRKILDKNKPNEVISTFSRFQEISDVSLATHSQQLDRIDFSYPSYYSEFNRWESKNHFPTGNLHTLLPEPIYIRLVMTMAKFFINKNCRERFNLPEGHPIACIIVSNRGEILSWGVNTMNGNKGDKIRHAEVNAIGAYFEKHPNETHIPEKSVLFTSLKSCYMCAGIIYDSQKPESAIKVIYGQSESRNEQTYINEFEKKAEDKNIQKIDETFQTHKSRLNAGECLNDSAFKESLLEIQNCLKQDLVENQHEIPLKEVLDFLKFLNITL